MTAKMRKTFDISTIAGRRAALRDFNWIDHQILRKYWTNTVEFAPGLWRSNQPCGLRLLNFKRLGVRTVVSLRAENERSYNLFQREACTTLGLDLRYVHVSSARHLPTAQRILEGADWLRGLQRPLLIHCKSGADRTGFAAALMLVLIEGRPVAEAARQLSRRRIHFPRSKAGVLSHVFRVYLRDAEPRGIGFRDWLEAGYDPDAITADFNDWRRRRGRWAK